MIDTFSPAVFLPAISLFKTVLTRVLINAQANPSANHDCESPKKTFYQLIIWDFGDTLGRLREAALAVGSEAIELELGCHCNTETLREAIRREWKERADEHSLNIIKAIDTSEKEADYYREFYACVVSTFSDQLPSKTLLDTLIDMQVAPESYELMQGAKDILEKLKGKGIRQAILSNGFVSTRKHIEYLEIQDYFDCIMVSCEEYAVKPDQVLYKRLLDCCRIKMPQETLFIDDRLEFIEGAARLKMNTLWFQRQDINEKSHTEEKITCLEQVFDKVVEKELEDDWVFRPHYFSARRAFS